MQRGLHRRLAARLAGRQQDAADDGLAALRPGACISSISSQQLGVGGEGRHARASRPGSPTASPAACPVRAPRPRPAGPCARCAPPRRRAGAASASSASRCAQVAADAADEDHQQRRVEHEADQQALRCTGSAGRGRGRSGSGERPVPHASAPRSTALVIATMVQSSAGRSSTAPSMTCSRYRKTKGLVAPPLDRAGRSARRRRPAAPTNSSPLLTGSGQARQRSWLATLNSARQRQQRQHLVAAAAACRSRSAPPDGDDLADHRDPAQLDQLQHVAAGRRGARGACRPRGGGGRRASAAVASGLRAGAARRAPA